MPRHRVLRPAHAPEVFQLSYGGGKVAYEGDEIDDLPGSSVGWLLEQGYIEPISEGKPKAKKGGE